jgi:hypothetical protein
MGYLIDEEGTIASELTTGAPALLALATTSKDGVVKEKKYERIDKNQMADRR